MSICERVRRRKLHAHIQFHTFGRQSACRRAICSILNNKILKYQKNMFQVHLFADLSRKIWYRKSGRNNHKSFISAMFIPSRHQELPTWKLCHMQAHKVERVAVFLTYADSDAIPGKSFFANILCLEPHT